MATFKASFHTYASFTVDSITVNSIFLGGIWSRPSLNTGENLERVFLSPALLLICILCAHLQCITVSTGNSFRKKRVPCEYVRHLHNVKGVRNSLQVKLPFSPSPSGWLLFRQHTLFGVGLGNLDHLFHSLSLSLTYILHKFALHYNLQHRQSV